MYLYRSSPDDPLVLHNCELHGYACEYIGGDSGPVVVAKDYRLHLDMGEKAVFRHRCTGKYFAAVRIGGLSMFPCGDDWRQEQAHIVMAREVFQGEGVGLSAAVGPFSFYDLLFLLEAGPVTPREAIVNGYFGDAVFNLRGHVREPACSTPARALTLLALIPDCQSAFHEDKVPEKRRR